MDFNATIDLIIRELNEAREIIEDLKKYPGVSVLEVELAKAKCKNAGEVIALLKDLQGNFPSDLKNEPESIKPAKEVIFSGPSVIADNFSQLGTSVNEQPGIQKGDEDTTGMLYTKRLSNLSEGIGVNDRFLYINEIFNGDKVAFSQAISRLDTVKSINDARAVITSYTGTDIDNDAVTQLLDLVMRKLHSDE